MKIVNKTSQPVVPTAAMRLAVSWFAQRAGLRLKDLGTITVVNASRGTVRLKGRDVRVNVPFYCITKKAGEALPPDATCRHSLTHVKRLDNEAISLRLYEFMGRLAWYLAARQCRVQRVTLDQLTWKWHHDQLVKEVIWSMPQINAWLIATAPKPKPPKISDPLTDKITKLRARLAEWHKKERLAGTKIKAYSRQLLRAERQRDKRAVERDSIRMFEDT